MMVDGFEFDVRALQPVLTGEPMRAAMVAAAERGKAWAEDESRRRLSDKAKTYPESFEVASTVEKVNGVNRATAWLVNTDPNAWAVEWPNGFHFLARAADIIEKGR